MSEAHPRATGSSGCYLTEILKKNRGVYDIQLVQLIKVVNTQEMSTDVAEGLRQVIFAAVSVAGEDSDPAPSSLDQTSSLKPKAATLLKSLFLNDNSLELQHVMAFCSSFRYGCALESLSLRSIFSGMNAENRRQCWRWLAFGLFRPRAKLFARGKSVCVLAEYQSAG